ncbi:chorismate--pyruvate lyase family protein [Alteromonas sp. a30]|uniref:chorismate--pyruvate lyase family protein n=1 Tax=Alteromonas sp. a30 TaxID=2730917 RepID=UPI0022832791|nr:chorismate lyase [Alteromonas sp. a30]MCY7295744.1 chorismate lyase [Alteromonas sp. a30]
MTHQSYPVGIQGQWHQPESVNIPDAHLKNWLMDTGSLTERLQASSHHFAVEVLGHEVAIIAPEEAVQLYQNKPVQETYTPLDQRTQVREVLLKGNHQNWVFARSLMPQIFIDECMQELGVLGNQPLGKILFNDARFQRLDFELIQCPLSHPICEALGMVPKHPLWGRRSLFQFQTHCIMVCEVFLPDSPAYRDMETK